MPNVAKGCLKKSELVLLLNDHVCRTVALCYTWYTWAGHCGKGAASFHIDVTRIHFLKTYYSSTFWIGKVIQGHKILSVYGYTTTDHCLGSTVSGEVNSIETIF